MAVSENPNVNRTVVQLSVPDMTCGHCAASISQAIQKLDVAASVAVDLPAKRVRVETALLDAKHIMAALEDAGFTPEHVLGG